MGLISNVLKIFSSEMTEEDEKIIQEVISSSKETFNFDHNHYINQTEAEEILSVWDTNVSKVKSIRIPKKHPLSASVQRVLNQFSHLNLEIEKHNQAYIKDECIRCNELLSDIDGKTLDSQQQAVVVCDENRNLVLAGAGSGKTLTIAAKVKYLYLEKNIDPKEILLITFTHKSAEEMTERIAKKLLIPVEASTFHKLGLEIITKATGKRPDVLDDLGDFIREYFEKYIVDDPQNIKILIEYFAYYLHIPANMDQFDSLGEAYEYEKGIDLETIKSKYDQSKYLNKEASIRKEQHQTLRLERVKSMEEATIANFLFLNGIEYEYEHLYPFESDDPTRKAYRPDFYLPEYNIYLEHFGVDRNGNLPWLSKIEEEKYQQDMKWKRNFHKEKGTKLIETYSYYSYEGVLQEKLDEILKKNGVCYKEPDFVDIYNTVYAKKGEKYFSEFIRLCCTFITLFKSNGYHVEDLPNMFSHNSLFQKSFFVRRTELFKKIIFPIMKAYENHLAENKSVDFADMIISATKFVNNGCELPDYKWVIIDEFQDVSVARYRLVQAILDKTGAKLLCVGDDWQSIYRFAGSDISIFTDFEKYFGKAAIMRLEQTYRNSQQLIDAAGFFVMQNNQQLKKQLRSEKYLDYPITFMCYQDNPFAVLQRTVNKIIHDFGKESSILLLGRTNYDVELIQQSGMFTVQRSGKCIYKLSPETPIKFMSVHKSKGLEADNVVLVNFENSTLGFPNKIADDPILELVLTTSDAYPYAEERRLLYVALTRTRNRTFVLVNEKKPSQFMKDFPPSKSVFILSSKKEQGHQISCPRCKTGHLITRKNSSNNHYFVSCSNYPRCQYTVHDVTVLDNPKLCPKCGGLLVRRKGRFGIFYGCSNYPLCDYTEEIKKEKTSNN